jgi:hypothetical protein
VSDEGAPLTCSRYWNFHPYNQRPWLAELHYDY